MDIYDFLISNSTKAKRLFGQEKDTLLNQFASKFVDENLLSKYILYWNSIKSELRKKMQRIELENLNNIVIPNHNDLYIYLERHKELFKGNLDMIFEFLNQQEPWEETDITMFNNSFEWFMAFTHEDEIVLLEL